MFNLKQVDVSSSVALAMASKDDAELGMMKRAAAITLEIYSKVFKENLKDVINADRVRYLPHSCNLYQGVFFCYFIAILFKRQVKSNAVDVIFLYTLKL